MSFPSWNLNAQLTNTAVFDDSNKPPVAVTVVQKDHSVTLCRIGLSINSCHEVVKRINKLEVDILY